MEKQKRKEREFLARQADILAEAEKHFSSKGYHHVTVAEIAKASGFSTGALYQFFDSKEHLYTSMILRKIAIMFQSIRERVQSAETFEDRLCALVEAHLVFVEENSDFYRILLRGENELSPETMADLRGQLIDFYVDYLSFIENILKGAIKKGLIRNLPSRDMASALSHLIRAVVFERVFRPTKESLRSKKELILDIFLHGVKKNEL